VSNEAQTNAILSGFVLNSSMAAAERQLWPTFIPPRSLPCSFSTCQLSKPNLRSEFKKLAEQWRKETRYLSSVNQASMHPAYLRIIGKGPVVVTLLLEELQARPDHWLLALNAISGEDPARESATFQNAVEDWLNWGRKRGYIF